MQFLLLVFAYVSALFLSLPVFLAIILVISLRWRGYGGLLIAFMVDVQFSVGVPWYTVATVMVLVVVEFLRPRLMIDGLL